VNTKINIVLWDVRVLIIEIVSQQIDRSIGRSGHMKRAR